MLQQMNNQWDALGENSLIPSASHTRLWLAPMFEHFRKSHAHLVFDHDSKPLQAITALKKVTLPVGFSLPIAQTWDNGFLFSGIPLIGRNNPEKAMTSLLANARQDMGVKAVLFKKIQRNSQFDQLLEGLSADIIAGYQLLNVHQRASLDCSGDFDTWFTNNFSRKRRKEYRRLRNRLAETGKLQSQTLQPGASVEPWIEEFIDLEAAGWKGRNGTAIASSTEQTAHLRHALPQMAQNGSLLFWKITLDDKPIASLFGFHDHNQVWLGKIAYDETLAHFSPGVLVILDATTDLFARDDVTIADSSADPDHPMINNIWRDRIDVADYMIATPGTGKMTFKVLVTLEEARMKLRNLVKSAYYRLRKGSKK